MAKLRQSNFEALRIIAMFLILVVHMDYFTLGAPTRAELVANPASSFARIGIESVSLICVNLFIFISGWFGITLRRQKMADLLFQIAYFYFGLFFIFLLLGKATLDFNSFKLLFLLTTWNWFIPAYILLCFLAPVLNSFVESASRKQFANVLLGFFAIQTWSGWYANSANFAGGGYTTLSFIGVYLLARLIRKYELARWFTLARSSSMFLACVALNTLFGAFTIYFDKFGWLYPQYINPLTIVATVSFAMIFANLSFRSNVVNFFAKSAFAVFLLHTNFNVFDYYESLTHLIFDSFDGLAVIGIGFLVCCGWYIAAVVLDQPRKALWRCLLRYKDRSEKRVLVGSIE